MASFSCFLFIYINVYDIFLFYDISLFNFDIPLVKRLRFFVHAVDFLVRLYQGKVDRVVQKSSHAVIVSAHTRASCVRTHALTHTHTHSQRVLVVIITPAVIRFESRPKWLICSCCTTRSIRISHSSFLVPSRIASAVHYASLLSFCDAICSNSDLPIYMKPLK